ncbi:type III secretion system chaperone family protein [Parasphingorhabdus pacifica]
MTRQDVTLSRREALTGASAIAVGVALTDPLQRWLLPTGSAGSGSSTLSEDELSGWEEIATQFRTWTRTPAGHLTRKAVIGQLNDVSDRLEDISDGPRAQRGFLVGAEFAEIAGAMSWDLGLHRSAQRYYTLAIQFAKVAGDDGFAGVTLAALARQCFDLDKPDDGLELVQLAQYGTRKSAGSTLRSMLATREAWSYAQCGQIQPFHRAVGLAEGHFADGQPTEADRWVTGFDLAELYGVIGARYRDLARHEADQARKAQDYIGRALQLRPPSHTRNRAFDLIGLARAHLITAEPDRACELIEEVLPLAHHWASGRVGAKLRDFHRETEPFATARGVKQTREAVRDLIEV